MSNDPSRGAAANSAGDPSNTPSLSDRFAAYLRPVIVVVFAVFALYYVAVSVHWEIKTDTPIMHYVNFLMSHGLKPYSDITDNNMPGAYYTDAWAMRVFGGGDVGWRVYEYFLTAVLTWGLVTLAKPYDWLAGYLASGLFLVIHGTEGPDFAVEREQVIAVLMVLAYVALFASVKRQKPALMGFLGVAGGLAASIKPTFVPLPLALMVVAAYVLRRRRISVLPYMVWGLAGLGAVGAQDVGFLLWHHAWHGFFYVLLTITPAYAASAKLGWGQLLVKVFQPSVMVMLGCALLVGVARSRREGGWDWQRWSLALGAGFGLVSFLVQGKGFPHHRYLFLVLLLLLISLELLAGLKQRGWQRLVVFTGFAFVFFWMLPNHTHTLANMSAKSDLTDTLESDLTELGGTAELQGKVQCFDLVYGCLNALYHLKLVENTGFTGDLSLFEPTDGVANRYYKAKFWDLASRDPATVLVVSNDWFGEGPSFEKLHRWPEFESYLAANYTEVEEKRFPEENRISRAPGPSESFAAYRIYVRNATPLLDKAKTLEGRNGWGGVTEVPSLH